MLIGNPVRQFYKASTNVIEVTVQIQNESLELSFQPRVGVAQHSVNTDGTSICPPPWLACLKNIVKHHHQKQGLLL